MNILVTGGAGFIGSHLTQRLLADGHRVRVLDDLSTGKKSNLEQCPTVEFIQGDVGDLDTVAIAVQGCQAVFHKAAIASVQRTVEEPLSSSRVNYQGTLNVLDAATKAGVKRVVFAASSAAYGNLKTLPASEANAVDPLSPYAVDKMASEFACRVYTQLHGLNTVCLRYFNVYGPRQDPSSPYSGVISLFARALIEGRAPTILGDGGQTRDFVFVGDVVEANLKALQSDAAVGKVINIGTGHATSIKGLFATLATVAASDIEATHGEARMGEVRDSVADVRRARELLGWSPAVSLSDGLARLWKQLGAAEQIL